jgi:hypothetical protein
MISNLVVKTSLVTAKLSIGDCIICFPIRNSHTKVSRSDFPDRAQRDNGQVMIRFVFRVRGLIRGVGIADDAMPNRIQLTTQKQDNCLGGSLWSLAKKPLILCHDAFTGLDGARVEQPSGPVRAVTQSAPCHVMSDTAVMNVREHGRKVFSIISKFISM